MDEKSAVSTSYTLFTGCLINLRYPHFEVTARESANRFGIQLQNSAHFTCCPDPVGMKSMDSTLWLTLAARNLSVGEEKGFPIATLCNGCFETLNTANRILKSDSTKKAQVNTLLIKSGREFKGALEVKHLVQILYEKVAPDGIRKAVQKPLTGMVLATHPGCHALRPSPFVRFDHPIEPKVLDEMVGALGAKVQDYNRKMMCCGLPIYNYDKQVSTGLAMAKVRYLQGVDGLVVTCPSCFLQFESAQLLAKDKTIPPLPIFYYFELLALALGVDPHRIGFAHHRIPVDEAIQKIQQT